MLFSLTKLEVTTKHPIFQKIISGISLKSIQTQPKRKHRHIVEIGLSLLYKSNPPYNYWSYAFSIAVYLINILPSSVLNFKSPWQSLYSKPPPLHALKSFGCACYPYSTFYNKNKLQPKSKEGIFLGYPQLSKGYICLDPSSNRIYIACFVLFNESLFPFTHNSACTNPNIPFTYDFSHCFPSSSPSISDPTDVPSSCDSSFPLDLITSLIPSALASSLLILVVPSPPDPPPIPDVPLPISSSIPSASSLPITHNTHPMVTRSKHCINKPKALQVTHDYTVIEPPSFAIAAKHP